MALLEEEEGRRGRQGGFFFLDRRVVPLEVGVASPTRLVESSVRTVLSQINNLTRLNFTGLAGRDSIYQERDAKLWRQVVRGRWRRRRGKPERAKGGARKRSQTGGLAAVSDWRANIRYQIPVCWSDRQERGDAGEWVEDWRQAIASHSSPEMLGGAQRANCLPTNISKIRTMDYESVGFPYRWLLID